MTHDQLSSDLAGHLRGERRMVWEDVQLGPSGSPRPDVFAIFKSFVKPQPMAYECKVSTSDFRSDVTSGKWQSYLRYACGVVFAVESSLGVSKGDVPTHAGLIVRGVAGWRTTKRPVLNPVEIPREALLKLLIDGVEREGPRYRAKSWGAAERAVTKAIGFDAGVFIRDRQAALADLAAVQSRSDRILAGAREQADAIVASAREGSRVWEELRQALELPEGAPAWDVHRAIRRLRRQDEEHPAAEQLAQLANAITHALQVHGPKPQQVAAGRTA